MSQSNQVRDTNEDASIQPEKKKQLMQLVKLPLPAPEQRGRQVSDIQKCGITSPNLSMRKVSKKLDAITIIENTMLIPK